MKIILTSIKVLVVLTAVLMLIPLNATGSLRPLGEKEMGNIYGQSGLAIHNQTIDANMRADTLSFETNSLVNNALGSSVLNTGSLFFSLYDVEMKRRIHIRNSLIIDIDRSSDEFSDACVTYVNIFMDDVVIQIDRFSTDGIRIGTQPGEGPNLGSLHINDMHIGISGSISMKVLA